MSDILIQYISEDNLTQYNEQTISYIKGYVTNQINNVTTIVATQIKNINDTISNDIVTKLTSHINNTEIHMTETKNSNLATAYNHSQSSHARADATKTSVTRTLNSGIKIGNITINDSTSVDLYAPAVVDNLTSTDKDKSLSANMGNKLNTEISELKKYVSDSKSNVASAITSMGVNTASDATFDTIVTNIKAISANTTAEAGHILDGKIVYLKGKYVTGNMPNRGNLSKNINAGSYVDIPAGYYSGGKITVTGLSGQTAATAAATDILTGKTAWVNGTKITGIMANNGAVTSSLNCGGSYTIPAGFHNGSGKITANSLSSQTAATAAASHILTGKTAWVNGSKITGTMANNGDLTKSLSAGGSLIISAGYYSGGKITVTGLSGETAGTATADTVLYNKTACVNGTKITGSIKNATIFLPYQLHSTTTNSSSFIGYNISSNENSKHYSIGTTYFTLTNVYDYSIKIAANNDVIFDFDLNKIDTIKSGTFSLIIDGYGSISIPSTGTNHNTINVNNKLYIEATYTSKVLSIQVANRTTNYISINYLYLVAYLTDSTNQLTDLRANMSRGATATAADIVSGETAWINGTKVSGTLTKQGACTSIGTKYLETANRTLYVNIPDGVYNTHTNSGYCEGSLALTGFGTAAPGDVLSGETFTSSYGYKQTGAIKQITDCTFFGFDSTSSITYSYLNETMIINLAYGYNLVSNTGYYTLDNGGTYVESSGALCNINATNSNNRGQIGVLIADTYSILGASSYDKIIVNYKVRTIYTDDAFHFRGKFGIIRADNNTPSTGAEGGADMIKYAEFYADTTSYEYGTEVIDISSFGGGSVRFAISLVHAGDLIIRSVIWIKEK